MFLCKISDSNVVNAAHRNHLFHNFDNCSLPLFAEVEPAARLTSSTKSSPFMPWTVAQDVSSGFFVVFFIFSVVCNYIVHLLMEIVLAIPSLGTPHLAAENSSDRFLYKEVSTGCESSIFTVFPSCSILDTSSC